MDHQNQIAVALFTLFIGYGSAVAAQTRPAVLEVFTSEGCSSCPPAELIVNELAQRPDVLPLSFHVDYWDDLGWRDLYSLPGATERQRGYARALRLPAIYTPEVVVDGVRELAGSQRSAVMEAVSGRRAGVATSIVISGEIIRVQVGAGVNGQSADVLLVGYLREASTAIGRGENSGRTLKESNIVLSTQVLGQWDGKPREFELSAGRLPKAATDIAVLVQAPGQGAILGALSRPFR